MQKSVLILLLLVIFCSCKQQNQDNVVSKKTIIRKHPKSISFHFEKTKQWLEKTKDSAQFRIVLAVNRTDKTNIAKMDSILIPGDLTGDIEFYLPFPLEVPYLKDINKVIFFSYPTQTFAAYENGDLIYTGPTNMGRKKDPTPTGLFYTNWKAEKTTSTFNDEWDLRWNFNIANKLGVGWHQYELPGYPASHSCLRLQEKDAKYLYTWADQWILQDDENVLMKGTPVIVFGSYPFGEPKPWLQLIQNPKALNISVAEIENITKPYLNGILSEQKKRENQPSK
ncbi:L,D-transpeptidase-like protein [Flavobacterium sp. 103]|uniref:L,D-transpeptidase n=1 Tax=Flavobacterium sp. 103 TaxID=2135624 RepID=UPI000D5DC817|nr:L,D-transpeptidase [Flavobacterium sp. 103]PVX47349.1 L,D-transpeptidase-like protein [Flavobacterium sp. 103]